MIQGAANAEPAPSANILRRDNMLRCFIASPMGESNLAGAKVFGETSNPLPDDFSRPLMLHNLRDDLQTAQDARGDAMGRREMLARQMPAAPSRLAFWLGAGRSAPVNR